MAFAEYPVTGSTGSADIIAWLADPTSAKLRTAMLDETGTGLLYFQSGDLGTPSAGVLTNATGLPVSTGISGLGAGVAAWLASPTSANLRTVVTDESGTGALLFQSGALGTPASGTLTSCTGLPISTGVSGLGTGIATALAVNTGSAGAPVLFNGALGTPSSGTLTSCTGLPISTGVSGLGAGIATALSVNTGSAGAPVLLNGALGTPSSGTLSSCTSLPATGMTMNTARLIGRTTAAAGASEEISVGSNLSLASTTLNLAASPSVSSLTASNTTNQIVLGTTNTTTLSATAPAASRVYTMPDVGGAADFVMTAGAQTVGGAKTLSSALTINPTTNQLVLGVTNTVTINSTAPAASRVYTIPDAGGAASFILTTSGGTQTIGGTGLTLNPTTLTVPASVTFSGLNTLTKAGNFAHTLTTTATSNSTFPAGTRTLASLDGSESLLNKTISSTADLLGALTLPSGTAAQRPTPTTGMVRLNTDTQEFEGYSNSAWQSIGSGLNELAQKNYLKAYALAQVSPGTLSTLASTTANLVSLTAFYADSTSGSAALATSTDSTLRGTQNYLSSVSGSNSTGTRFFQFPAFALDGTDLGKPIQLSFDVSGVTTDGNWDVVVVRYNSSGTHQSIISVAGNASGATPVSAKLPTGVTRFQGFFVPDSTTAGDIYAVRFRSLANAVNIRLDTIFAGPQVLLQGQAVTDWQSYPPIVSNLGTGIGTADGYWRRVGDAIELRINFVKDGSGGSGASNVTFSLPSGLSIDTTKVANDRLIGTARLSYTSNETWVTYNTGTSSTALIVATNGGYQTGASFTASSRAEILALVPITGWSSNVTVADRAVEQYGSDDGTNDVFGPNGSLVPNVGFGTGSTTRDFAFTTANTATDLHILEYKYSSTGEWTAMNGLWPFIGGNNAGTTNFYGVQGFHTGSTYRVEFGNQGTRVSSSAANNGAEAWSARFSAGDRFRLRRVSGGAVVGYPVSSANIVGRTDGNAPASGMVGETLSGTYTSAALSANLVATNAVTLNLTSGVWALYAEAHFTNAVSLVNSSARLYIGITPTSTELITSATSLTRAANQIRPFSSNNNMQVSLPVSIPSILITGAGTTPYYCVVFGDGYTSGSWQVFAKMFAVRIA